MEHFIITNRKVRNDSFDWSDIQAQHELRFAKYKAGKIVFYDDPVYKEEITYDPLSPNYEEKGSAQFFNDVYECMFNAPPHRKDTLIYIHGCNETEEKLYATIHKLEDVFVNQPDCYIGRIIYISWPSDERAEEFKDYELDAVYSGIILSRVYLKLMKFYKERLYRPLQRDKKLKPSDLYCMGNIHVMAHSMGARLLESFLDTIIKKHKNQITQLFDQVILTAPDVEYAAFEHPKPFSRLTDFANRVVILYHQNDVALNVSNTVLNPFKRLGASGPKNIKILNQAIYPIDVSQHKNEGFGDKLHHHWYHLKSNDVVHFLRGVFNGNEIDELAISKGDLFEV